MARVRIVIRWSPVRLNRAIPNVIDRVHCLIGGHADQMFCREGTVALHCERCGRNSPGWHVDQGTRPRRA